MDDDENKKLDRRSKEARRMTDMIAEVRDSLRDHLKECYDVRVEQNKKLDSLAKHLEDQDKDLEGIRTIKKLAGWGMGALVAIEAVANIARAVSGH